MDQLLHGFLKILSYVKILCCNWRTSSKVKLVCYADDTFMSSGEWITEMVRKIEEAVVPVRFCLAAHKMEAVLYFLFQKSVLYNIEGLWLKDRLIIRERMSSVVLEKNLNVNALKNKIQEGWKKRAGNCLWVRCLYFPIWSWRHNIQKD